MTFTSRFEIGEVIHFCGDKDWKAVIAAVSFSRDKVLYQVVWRDGYTPREMWLSEGEIEIYDKLMPKSEY